jgi:hypothetical protein
MTAPERIWAGEGEYWDKPHVTNPTAEYILHTRAALAASPLVQEIVAEAFRAGFLCSGEGWNGEYPDRFEGTKKRDDWLTEEIAKHVAAIRARGEG